MAGFAAMRGAFVIPQALTLLAVAAPLQAAADRDAQLLPMSREQVRAASAAGTGCSGWLKAGSCSSSPPPATVHSCACARA